MSKKFGAVLVGIAFLVLAGWLAYVRADASGAAFSISPSNPDINTEVLFDANDSGSSVSQYEWDFENDGEYDATSEEATITHIFDESGAQTVKLRVTDSRGSQETITQSITVRSASVRIRREITTPLDPNRVSAGSAFQVKVTVDFLEPVTAPGLDEDLPSSWRISSVSHGNALFKSSESAWLMTSVVDAGTVWEIVYNVTVASGTTSGIYEISGVFSSRSISNPIEISVPGDRFVRVI